MGQRVMVDLEQRLPGDERWITKRGKDSRLRRVVNRIRLSYWKHRLDPAPLTLITGASDNHGEPLMRFLRSAIDHEPHCALEVFDLGLSASFRDQISRHVRLRKFDFSNYPSYFDISRERGQYAWKPTIIKMVADERPGEVVCWMDAGHIVTGALDNLRAAVASNGFYSPIGYWYFGDWIHPSMLEYFSLPDDWRYWNWTLTAGTAAFDTRRPKARQLLDDWARYAAQEDCIAPAGSNHFNHRQDQALLTLLAYRAKMVPLLAPTRLGFVNKQDKVSSWPTLQPRPGTHDVSPSGLAGA